MSYLENLKATLVSLKERYKKITPHVWLDFERRGLVAVENDDKNRLIEWLKDTRSYYENKRINDPDMDIVNNGIIHEANAQIFNLMQKNRCYPNIVSYLAVDRIRDEIVVPLLQGEITKDNIHSF